MARLNREGKNRMSKIIGKIAFGLYLLVVAFYFIYYNNGLDTGLPGYIAAIQDRWFGGADERLTIGLAAMIFLIPLIAVMAFTKRPGRTPQKPVTKPGSDWAESLVATGVVVAVVALAAHFFLGNEIEVNNSAKIYQIDLNDDSMKLPDDARYASVFGKFQGKYLFVIESVRNGKTDSAKVYVPITAKTWTPDQPVTHVAELSYGYSYEPAKDGKGRDYSIDESPS
jgi:hypothetical protein